MKLYEIDSAIRALLDTEDGELTEDAIVSLSALEIEFERKAEACLQFRAELEAEANALKAEKDRLSMREGILRRRADWLKNYVFNAMLSTGIGRVSTLTFNASISKGPPAIKIAEGTEPDPGYVVIKREWDKRALLEAAKAGVELPAGVTVGQNQYLRIS